MKRYNLKKSFLSALLICLSLIGFAQDKLQDKKGNVYYQQNGTLIIEPAKPNKTGKQYKDSSRDFRVFFYNETGSTLVISDMYELEAGKSVLIDVRGFFTLKLNNGVKFIFNDEYGLEVSDKKSQVSGLGGEYLEKYQVPDEAQWAFTIVPPGKGD